MEIIEIDIEFPGDLSITDKATWNTETGEIHTSERLKQILRDLRVTEALPLITATCHGQTAPVEATANGDFRLASGAVMLPPSKGLLARFRQVIRRPTKDQRHEMGRYLHTLSAASIIGAIGFWHTTKNWDWQNILSETNLWIAGVLVFYMGIICINGD